MNAQTARIASTIAALFLLTTALHAQGVVIPTGASQTDYLNACKFILGQSSVDYRFTNATMDTTLFPRWGEETIYWVRTGPDKGSFIYSDRLPPSYSSVYSEPYFGYDWRAEKHSAISFKGYSNAIAVFKSGIKQDGNTISWEAVYFKNLIESFLYSNTTCYIDEKRIDTSGIAWSTQLLIFPAFAVDETDWEYYIDTIFEETPNFEKRLKDFLGRGGTIYAEGNAVYLLEKLGLLKEDAVNYAEGVRADPVTNSIELVVPESDHPVSFAKYGAGTSIHASTIPQVDAEGWQVLAAMQGTNIPVVFALSGEPALGGRVVCNTALPAVGGSKGMEQGTGPATRHSTAGSSMRSSMRSPQART